MAGRAGTERVDLPPSGPNAALSGIAASVAGAFARWPWYAKVLLVWALARVFSFGVFVAVAARQGLNPWGWEGPPSYLQFIGAWDSEWYRRIFAGGYPTEIPRDVTGRALENEWAFYPLFPGLVRALDAVTILDAAGSQYEDLLRACMEATPTCANLDEYLEILQSAARLETLRRAAYDILDAGSAQEADRIIEAFAARNGLELSDYPEELRELLQGLLRLRRRRRG